MSMKNQTIKIALSGASGRMGQAVKALIKKRNSGWALVSAFPVSSVLGEEELGAKEIRSYLNHWEPKKIQGVIDFSSPVLFREVLKWCVKNQKPFVSGTTGLSVSEKLALKRASQKIPVFYEQNMSWGIYQIKKWLESLSKTSYEITLTDIHHKHKKDRPSGTALKLKKHFPSWAEKSLKIKSLRKGDVFGTHNIVFKGKEECVSLEHRALSRKLFAGGALRALKWLILKPPGFYSFDHLY